MAKRLITIIFLISIGTTPKAVAEFRTQFDVAVPMRDGIRLSADIWFPSKIGRYPTILVRTPYLKTDRFLGLLKLAQFYADHDYVFIIQDVRGRGDSQGEFEFLFTEGKDGYDTIEWAASQQWSDGRVGMLGPSYMGTVQWLAAREHPPHLVCIAPTAAAGRYFDEIPYQGGAFQLDFALSWLNGVSGHINQGFNAQGVNMREIFKHRPVVSIDEALGRHMRIFREFLEHDTLDEYWKRIQFSDDDFRKLNLPALTITGWFDGDQPGALFYWRNMRVFSPAKDNQFLLAGPWTHVQSFVGGSTKLGEFEFSSDAIYDIKALQLAFFDRFLKGNASPGSNFPRARVYVMGKNKWRDDDEYPPVAVQVRKLYFHSGGNANTLGGDGRLSWNAPENESADHYTYFPVNPVSPAEGEEEGADQRYIERRDDVLVYTTDTLTEPVEIIGNVFVHLFASSDARDTDFTARLLDVSPQGHALQLGSWPTGIIRARYRNGRDRIELLIPNKTEHYRIELFDMAHMFLAGHKIRIEISSSYAPSYNPNPNTGNPISTDIECRSAKQSIFHDRAASSYVALPVIPSQ